MAWMAMTAGLWREPVKARWNRATGEIAITVIGCGCMQLTPDETKALIRELDSALAESEADGLDESADDAASLRRARLMLVLGQAG